MIYLDHNATTFLRPEVRAAVDSFLDSEFANPSSSHRLGSAARCAIEDARTHVAEALGVAAAAVIFTSGGTEANNLALRGLRRPGTTSITTPIEHSSVLAPLREGPEGDLALESVRVDSCGFVDLGDLERLLAQGPAALVSVGWANNEIGTVQPMREISQICRAADATLHTDAVQAFGKVPVDADLVDAVSISAHKVGGPMGVGALILRTAGDFNPLVVGGGQERGRRSGTENVPGIVGFGEACRLLHVEAGAHWGQWASMRDLLWSILRERHPAIARHTPKDTGLPNTLSVRFPGIVGEALVAALDVEGVAASSGSACAAGSAEPSHVLTAIGVEQHEARDGVRFSVGRGTTLDEVRKGAEVVLRVVDRMHAARPSQASVVNE